MIVTGPGAEPPDEPPGREASPTKLYACALDVRTIIVLAYWPGGHYDSRRERRTVRRTRRTCRACEARRGAGAREGRRDRRGQPGGDRLARDRGQPRGGLLGARTRTRRAARARRQRLRGAGAAGRKRGPQVPRAGTGGVRAPEPERAVPADQPAGAE